MKEFDYYRPSNIREALDITRKLGEGGAYLNGGTDLIVRMKEKLEQPRYVIDIKEISELKTLIYNDKGIHIGSLTTLNEISNSLNIGNYFPGLKEAASSVGSYQVRARGTLTGNLVSSVPSADMVPILLCYDSEVLTIGLDGERRIKLSSFIKGPRLNVLKPGELVKEIFISHPRYSHMSIYLKLGRRAAVDLAVVGVAALVLDTPSGFEYRVALGAVAPTPIRATKIENYLRHKVLTSELVEEGLPLILEEVSPIDDVRSSRQYRLEMCKVFTKRALLKAWEKLLLLREVVI